MVLWFCGSVFRSDTPCKYIEVIGTFSACHGKSCLFVICSAKQTMSRSGQWMAWQKGVKKLPSALAKLDHRIWNHEISSSWPFEIVGGSADSDIFGFEWIFPLDSSYTVYLSLFLALFLWMWTRFSVRCIICTEGNLFHLYVPTLRLKP